MKQRITIKQVEKLTDTQKKQLREWWKPQAGDYYYDRIYQEVFFGEGLGGNEADTHSPDEDALPLLSIGQMIQFINEKKPLKSISKARFDKWIVNIDTATLGYKDELCDSLWETVTRIL